MLTQSANIVISETLRHSSQSGCRLIYSDNVYARPCIYSHVRHERNNDTESAIYVMWRRR